MNKQTLSNFGWAAIAFLIVASFIVFGPGIARFLGSEILGVFPQLFLDEENETQIQEDCVEFKSFFPFSISVPDKGWNGNMQYYDGEKWVENWNGTEIKSAKSGYWYYICIRGVGNTVVTKPFDTSSWTYYPWKLDGREIYCSGNIETLLDYKKVQEGKHPTMGNKCYAGLFQNCEDLISAPYLPATALTESCYRSMFNNCTKLKIAPKISAETAEANSCNYMFAGCEKLVIAPELPATTVKDSAYYYMFAYCTSLKNAPSQLPAENLGANCYRAMFIDCTALKNIPSVLPAEILADRCYQYMFEGCTRLVKAPKLLATNMEEQCCMAMFRDCTSLKDVPYDMLPATRLYEKGVYDGSQCYSYMFEGCTSLKKAPNLPADQYLSYAAYQYMFKDCTSLTDVSDLKAWYLTSYCYRGMFQNCKSLKSTPNMTATTLGKESCKDMFKDCTSLTTIAPTKILYLSTKSCAYMFSGCTSLVSVPTNLLPAKSLDTVAENIEGRKDPYVGINCYEGMFSDCTKLKTAPALPATVLADGCYRDMFYACTSLTQAPEKLPAKILTSSCYRAMFWKCKSLETPPEIEASGFVNRTETGNSCDFMFAECSSLKKAPALYAEILAPSCYFYMFAYCTSLEEAPVLPAMALAFACYDGMFKDCTNLKKAPALPAVVMPTYCYCEMFRNCTSLNTIPKLPAGEVQAGAYKDMFLGCSLIKLSETKTGEYTKPYYLPGEEDNPEKTNEENGSLYNMFESTGGPWKGTPIKSVYYLHGSIEVQAQLQGYIEFASTEPFTLGLQSEKGWKGIIQYKATDDRNTDWKTWEGEEIVAGKETEQNSKGLYVIRLRGENNTVVSGFKKVDNVDKGGRGWTLNGTADIECNGNIECLLDYKAIQNGEESPPMAYACFWDLFKGCKKLVKGPDLPSVAIVDSCYRGMFENCTDLKVAPVLPATTMQHRCYTHMFAGCTSLVDAPDLPATKLANSCYSNMFYGCTSLETVPELPATELEIYCYNAMFQGCTALKEIPYLPATTLKDHCYNHMFHDAGITISTERPNKNAESYYIPVTKSHLVTLEEKYPVSQMFGSGGDSSCVGVIKSEKPFYFSKAIKVVGNNFLEFISDSQFTITAPKKWDGKIEYNRGDGWKVWDGKAITSNASLHYVYLRGTNNGVITGDNENAENRWILNGTNIKCNGNIEYLLDYKTVKAGGHPEMDQFCYMAMFHGATGLVKAPDLPATTISNSCYRMMFKNCTNLVEIPDELPAMTTVHRCYAEMFAGCTSIVNAPNLPATNAANTCYSRMFQGCTSLKTVSALPATDIAMFCYFYMFEGCSSLEEIPYLPATVLKQQCYNYMFYNAIKMSSTKTSGYQTEYAIVAPADQLANLIHPVSQMFISPSGGYIDIAAIFKNQQVVYLPDNITIVGAPSN